MKNDLVNNIAGYYSQKLSKHGAVAKGVDWNGEESQNLRFEQLCKLFENKKGFFSEQTTVSDLGCGYAAFHDYLLKVGVTNYEYHGYDISEEMCKAATHRLTGFENTSVHHSAEISKTCDYGVASGIFSVSLNQSDERWLDHLYQVLQNMNEKCSKGFAFNCLTKYSDADKLVDNLYYADPLVIFDYCKREFSRNIALLHDYGLYEFTILVRK